MYSGPSKLFTRMILACLCAMGSLSCAEKQKRSLNISAGFADQTLKEFARQAKVEIIFDPESVYGVKTHSVNGDYDPQSALRVMLKDTPLSVDYDDETGAYAIIRVELSNCLFRIRNIDTNRSGLYVYSDAQTPFMIKNLSFF